MIYKTLTLACLGYASAGATDSIEFTTADLSRGGGALDNIKAKWSQSVKLFGNEATFTGSYDRNENKDFLNEATVSGTVDSINYEVKTDFDSNYELTIDTSTSDGMTLEAVANNNDGVTDVSASKKSKVGGQDCDVDLSHSLGSSESKLKLSTVLGGGVKAIGTLVMAKGGATSTDYELEYEKEMSAGRTLTATMNPSDGTGEVIYEDTTTIDGTITATIPMGGKPKVTLSRKFNFN